jgi:alcohol/geraniol dehydrogenase (NADP+)
MNSKSGTAISCMTNNLAEAFSAVRAFAALAPGQALQPWVYEPGPLGRDEIEVAVTHCGVCHTDLHLIDNDLGLSTYPLVPGHEVIGTVTAVGDEVGGLAVGQRVGVGWQRGACNQCEWCRQGLQNLCAGSRPTALAGYGGFAQSLRVDHQFAIPIPDALDSAIAAPLLCGGITVYAPLIRLVRPGSRVGIIGIGGLGHLALQFARAMGAEVVAFSTSADKQQEAHRLGAHNFVVSADSGQMGRVAASLDVLLSTATANLDWSAWLGTLRPNGTLCLVGVVPGPVTLPALPMILGQFTFSGSVIGAPRQIGEMLRFAARHNVRAAVEVLPMEQVNLALEKVRRNQARYRMVLAR